MIEAKIIKDSINKDNNRLTTFVLTYHRFVLSELNTHRMFSRSSSSSRAIPSTKMLKNLLKNPAMPVYWGENKPGMQADTELTGMKLSAAIALWKIASYNSALYSFLLHKLGVHKQIANRIIEPWMYTKTILTATDFNNFFDLRCHADAQPEIRELATKMKYAYDNSTPTPLSNTMWHLPYITEDDLNAYSKLDCIKMSVARCARVSYANHDGTSPTLEKDIELHDKLVSSTPKHMSPAEHQAMAMSYKKQYFANFNGWKQYRWFIEHPAEKMYV